MEQEATQELVRRYRHDLLLVAVCVVSPAERNAPIVAADETMVRDGDAVGVSGQIGEHRLGSGERRLGVDDPCDRRSPGKENGM